MSTNMEGAALGAHAWALGADGVAVLRAPSGAFGPATLAAFAARVEACLDDPAVAGLVIAADDGGFFGELDLAWLRAAVKAPAELAAFAAAAAALARRLAESHKPVAAAIGAAAQGVGLELAQACHRRFAAQAADCTLGFTQSRYGLAPLLGTAPRLARRLGAEAAARLLKDPSPLTPAAALRHGLVDALLPREALLDQARQWVLLQAAQHAQRPAERAIDAAVSGGAQDDRNAFASVAMSPVAQDMVRTLGLSVADANRLASRPKGIPTRRFERVGVLGAGLMGGGIALVAARAGMQVVLVDRSEEAARRGWEALAKQEQAGVAAGRIDAQVSQDTLARIQPTARYEALAGVDIVVEAVFEDREVKAEATRLAEAAAGPAALLATNTSTLPITGLAQASVRPQSFIGLHFFSPVPRMPLLEIIRGQRTSDETLAHAMDFARAIGKTPIVVNDARGFYTTRVVMAYQAEAFDMLAQGCDPAVIEAGGAAAGMPVPPLALSDAVALDLIHQINLQAARDLGDAYAFTPGYAMVGRLVEQHGRKGKKNGKGFYDYSEDGGKRFWGDLRRFAADGRTVDMDVADARDRLLAAQALETVRCLEEGVITDPSQCDVGAILGWGFAPWTGGPLSWIDRMGVANCVERCDQLSQRYGSPRLLAPAALRGIAQRGESVYGASWPPA